MKYYFNSVPYICELAPNIYCHIMSYSFPLSKHCINTQCFDLQGEENVSQFHKLSLPFIFSS